MTYKFRYKIISSYTSNRMTSRLHTIQLTPNTKPEYKITFDNTLMSFNKLNNILYSANVHLFYDINLFISKNPHELFDRERTSFFNKNINNPRFLFLSLSAITQGKICLGVFDNTHKYKWDFTDNCIYSRHTKMYLNTINCKLGLSHTKTKWDFADGHIKNTNTNMYIAIDYNYKLRLTTNLTESSQFCIEDNSIHYMKPYLLVRFEINNYKQRINIDDFVCRAITIRISKQYNVGILLAAGTSSRFQSNTHKQLHVLNGKPIIHYSIDVMLNTLDHLIIVTNDACYDDIESIVYKYLTGRGFSEPHNKVTLLKNNINCRLESIGVAHQYIKNCNMAVSNMLIHDSARPFITNEHITTLLNLNTTCIYSQYYIKLLNGLVRSAPVYEFVNRDEYIEACSPQCINYNAFDFVFQHYIDKPNRITHEFHSIIQLLNLKYTFVEGIHKHLRKITTIDDVDN